MSDYPDLPDYPAAHSMDTEWFAIDANGHIGVFDSGENGAVPSDYFRNTDKLELFAREVLDLKPQEIRNLWERDFGIYGYYHENTYVASPYNQILTPAQPINVQDLSAHQRKVMATVIRLNHVRFADHDRIQPIEHTKCKTWDDDGAWIDVGETRPDVFIHGFWFAIDMKGAIAMFEPWNAGAIPRSANSVYRHQILNALDLARYLLPVKSLQSKKVRLQHWESSRRSERKPFAEILGIFQYEHPADNACRTETSFIAEPYEIEVMPTEPLTIADLTEEVRSLLQLTQFNAIAFDETKHFQPLEHLPCNVWDGTCTWLDTDGNDHWDIDQIRR